MQVENRVREKFFTLKRAILIRESTSGSSYSWGHSGNGDGAIASIHNIEIDKTGKAHIEAGTLLTNKGLTEIVKTLMPEKRMSFIDDRVLSFGVEGLMWFKRPVKSQMVFFNTNFESDGIGEINGNVPLPGLVFLKLEGAGWYVFAIKGGDRPTAQTMLYQVPFYNVSSNGLICAGNSEIPQSCTVEDMDGYENGFFGSRFTHPNVATKKKLTKYRGGGSALWKSLLKGKRKEFPESSLVPLNVTVGELLSKISGDKKI